MHYPEKYTTSFPSGVCPWILCSFRQANKLPHDLLNLIPLVPVAIQCGQVDLKQALKEEEQHVHLPTVG